MQPKPKDVVLAAQIYLKEAAIANMKKKAKLYSPLDRTPKSKVRRASPPAQSTGEKFRARSEETAGSRKPATSIEFTFNKHLLDKSIYNPHSECFTLFNQQRIERSLKRLTRKASHKLINASQQSDYFRRNGRNGSIDTCHTTVTGIPSQDSTRNGSLVEKQLEQKREIKPLNIAIIEQIGAEETERNRKKETQSRGLKPSSKDSISSKDVSAKQGVKQSDSNLATFSKQGIRGLTESYKSNSKINIPKAALNLKTNGAAFKSIENTSAFLSDSQLELRVQNEKPDSKPDNLNNTMIQPVENDNPTSDQINSKILSPHGLTHSNGNFPPIEMRRLSNKDSLSHRINTASSARSIGSNREYYLTASDKNSANNSTVLDESFNENYRQSLKKSLENIGKNKLDFNTLCAIRSLPNPHPCVKYSCMSLVMLLAGNFDGIPQEALYQGELSWEQIRTYLHDITSVHLYMNLLSTSIETQCPSRTNVAEALIYLDKSTDLYFENKEKPWVKLVRALNDYIQAIINYCRLVRDDRTAKKQLVKLLESPKETSMPFSLLSRETQSTAIRARNLYSPKQPSSFLQSTPMRVSPQKSLHNSFSGKQTPNVGLMNENPNISLNSNNMQRDSPLQLFVPAETLKFAFSRIFNEGQDFLLLCCAFFALLENVATTIPLFLCRPTIIKKNWDNIKYTMCTKAVELAGLSGKVKNLFETKQISQDQIKEAKRLLVIARQQRKIAIGEVEDKVGKTMTTIENYVEEVTNLYETLYGKIRKTTRKVSGERTKSPAEDFRTGQNLKISEAKNTARAKSAVTRKSEEVNRSQSQIRSHSKINKHGDSKESAEQGKNEIMNSTTSPLTKNALKNRSTSSNIKRRIDFSPKGKPNPTNIRPYQSVFTKQISDERTKILKKYLLLEQECHFFKKQSESQSPGNYENDI